MRARATATDGRSRSEAGRDKVSGKTTKKDNKKMEINRRGFLFGSAAAVTLAGVNTAKAGVRQLKKGEKRNIAMIGYGIQMRTALIPQFLNKKYILT